MSFENSAKAVSSELKKLQRYLEQGKYESMDFRGIASKLRGLAKAVSSTDEQATFLKLQGAYASLRAARANYDKSISTVADVVDIQAKVYKQEAKKLTKTAEEIAKNTKKFSDVYASVDQKAERIRPEKPEEEQLVINLVKSLVETRKYFDKDIKELTKKIRSGKKSSLNTSELETRLLNLKKQKEASIVSVINAGLAKEISKDRNANRFFKSGDTLESAITLLLDEIYGHSDEASIMEQIYNFQNAKNLRKKVKYKKVHERGAQTQDRALVGLSGAWTALMSQSPEARNNRKAAGTIDSFLEWFLNQNKVFSSNKKNFKQFLFNTMHANLASMGLNMDSLDSNIQDTYGLMVATLRDILSSNNLADIYKESFGTDLKDPKKVGLDAMSILDDVNKTLAVFRRYTPLTDEFVIGSNNRLYTMASALEEITTTDNIPINPEDLKKYSAVLSLFGGLGVDKNTPAYVRMWKDNVSNYGVDLNNKWVYELLSSGRGFSTFSPSEIESLIGPGNRRISLGDINDYKRYTRRAEKDPDKASKGYGLVPIKSGLPDMYYGHSRRDTSEDRWRLTQFLMYWINSMMQRKLGGVGPAGLIGTASNFGSNAIVVSKQGSNYDGLNLPAVVPEVISSDDSTLGSATKSIDKSKSASQKKQEAKDKKRQEQKSFIDLLIPALSKLLKKAPIWDVIKMLLFKLGATHPKTAAALILGGAPLAFGAARLLTRGILGIPNLGALTTGTSAATAGLTASKGPGVWSSITSNIRRVNARHAAYVRATKNVSNLGTGGPVMYVGPQGVASTSLHSARLGNYKNPLAHYGKAISGGILKGFKNNAIANWAKYSKNGKFGTLGTLGRAAKGIPGLSAVVEILGDIPNIMTAARSGKKGALSKQLWSTGGAALGAFAGAFLGPIGMLLGPLLGRGLGQGIGSRMEYLLRAIGDLGSAFSGLVQGIRDSWFGDALKLCGDAIVKFGELVGQGLMNTITILIKALGWLCDTIRWVVDEKYRNEKARGGDGKKQSQYMKDLDDPNSDAYKKIGQSQEFYKKLESTLGIESTNSLYGRNYKKIHSAFMEKRTKELKAAGKKEKDAKAQATKEFKNAYNSAYAYIVNQSKKAAEGKLNNISTYGNVAGASVDGLTRYSRKASGEISQDTKGNLVYVKDLKLAGTVSRGNSKPYVPVEYVGDLRYLDNTLNGMSLGKVTYSSNMGGAHNSGKNSHYNGKKVDVVTGKPLSVEQYTRLYNEGWFGHGTGAIGYEYYSGQKNTVTPAQYAQLMAAGKVVMSGNNHYDFGYLSAHGKSVSTSTSGASTGTSTETKVFQQTKDDVRSALLDFAKATNAKNKKDTIDRIVWDPTDVTGSLGCWGIVQLNNTGQMAY